MGHLLVRRGARETSRRIPVANQCCCKITCLNDQGIAAGNSFEGGEAPATPRKGPKSGLPPQPSLSLSGNNPDPNRWCGQVYGKLSGTGATAESHGWAADLVWAACSACQTILIKSRPLVWMGYSEQRPLSTSTSSFRWRWGWRTCFPIYKGRDLLSLKVGMCHPIDHFLLLPHLLHLLGVDLQHNASRST